METHSTWLLEGEEYEPAIECFDKALEMDPSGADTYVEKGTALLRMKKVEEAVPAATRRWR